VTAGMLVPRKSHSWVLVSQSWDSVESQFGEEPAIMARWQSRCLIPTVYPVNESAGEAWCQSRIHVMTGV